MERSINRIQGKNCHEYCPYRKQCRYQKGDVGLEPEDCNMYYKLEDILNDSRMEEKEKEFEEVEDW